MANRVLNSLRQQTTPQTAAGIAEIREYRYYGVLVYCVSVCTIILANFQNVEINCWQYYHYSLLLLLNVFKTPVTNTILKQIV